MKNFDTSRLEVVINEDIESVRKVFAEYTKDVARLMQLQKSVACIDNSEGFEKDMQEIESLLFNPNVIDQIEQRLEMINVRIQQRFEYRNTLQKDNDINDFIVADSNRLAFSMAESVIDRPGDRFNPLFLHGSKSTGKTFLLHAIGNEVFHKHPPMVICYVHANKFISHLIEAIKDGKVDEFNDYYTQIDFWLFDDIHLLKGKERTQEEFFHLYNHLIAEGKQIVIASDRPPQYLLTFDDRLRSRFKSGLVAELGSLDKIARKQALESLFKRCNLKVSDELINSIVNNTNANVKEISHILEQSLVQSSSSGQMVTEEMIHKLLSGLQPVKETPDNVAPIKVSAPVRLLSLTNDEIQKKLITEWPNLDDFIEPDF